MSTRSMIGRTLTETRAEIDRLADHGGEYYIRCGRTGQQPFPIAGTWFSDRKTAAEAVRYAREYRSELRRWDPQLPMYDLIVCEQTGGCMSSGPERSQQISDTESPAALPVAESTTEFCHSVACAVFETLTDHGFDTVQTTIMDAYLKEAEDTENQDEFCLVMLGELSRTIEEQLSGPQQTIILRDVAARLPLPEVGATPVRSALRSLKMSGLIDTAATTAWSDTGPTDGWTITLQNYSFGPRRGRLPVLPIVVELLRHDPETLPDFEAATGVDDGWQLDLRNRSALHSGALTSAPIRPNDG